MPTTEECRPTAPVPGDAGWLAPEARAVLLTAVGPEADEELRALLGLDLRWPLLLHIALHERAVPAVWQCVQRLGPNAIPAPLADALRPQALVAGFGLQHLQQRFADAIDLLEQAGCSALLLKGAAVGLSVNGSPAIRPMGDIDLVLPGDQVRTAFELLLAAGWQREMPDTQDNFYADHHHLPPLRDPRHPGTVLELHHDLLPARNPFVLTVDHVWRHARQVEWRGHSVHVPSVTHMLLHLCIHYAWAHTLSRGTWRTFSDLHMLTRGARIDWDNFIAAAHAARAATCCYWTLRLAARYGRLQLPADVLPALRPPASERWFSILERHLAANMVPGRLSCPSVGLTRLMWTSAIRPGRSGHGAARPWDGEPRRPRERRASVFRLDLHVRRIAALRRYAGALLAG